MSKLKLWLRRPKVRRALRTLAVALVASLIGMGCGYLPEAVRPACKAAAALVSAIFGGR